MSSHVLGGIKTRIDALNVYIYSVRVDFEFFSGRGSVEKEACFLFPIPSQ